MYIYREGPALHTLDLYFYQNVLFHPNGDDDEEDEQEGELGGDYVSVCYSSPRYKYIFFFLS